MPQLRRNRILHPSVIALRGEAMPVQAVETLMVTGARSHESGNLCGGTPISILSYGRGAGTISRLSDMSLTEEVTGFPFCTRDSRPLFIILKQIKPILPADHTRINAILGQKYAFMPIIHQSQFSSQNPSLNRFQESCCEPTEAQDPRLGRPLLRADLRCSSRLSPGSRSRDPALPQPGAPGRPACQRSPRPHEPRREGRPDARPLACYPAARRPQI